MAEKPAQRPAYRSLLLWISRGRGVLYANDAFCEYVGLPIEQIVGIEPENLANLTTGEIAEFFANPFSSAIPNRLLADQEGHIFEIKTAARQGMLDVIMDEISVENSMAEFFSNISGTPLDQLDEEELRTVRVPDLRFITSCAARLKSPSSLKNKISPLEHRIITGIFLEETTKPLLDKGCTLLPSRGAICTGFAGAPRYHADHSLRALEAAFEQLWRIERVRTNCLEEGRELPPIACGIASGNAIVGGFGSGHTAVYLAEGECVDTAEGLSRIAVPGEILISRITLDHLLANLDPQWQSMESESTEEIDLAPYAAHVGTVVPLENIPRIVTIGPAPTTEETPPPVYLFQELWSLFEEGVEPIPIYRAFRLTDSPAPQSSQETVLDTGYVARLGRYRLSEVIGSGGMGRVWKAQDAYGNTVAIKSLHPATAESPESIRRFRREAEVMSRIPHRNICRIFETGEQDGTHFIVMEYVEGLTLSDLLHPDSVSTASRTGKSTDLPSLIAAVRKQRSSMAKTDVSAESFDTPDETSGEKSVKKSRQGYILPVDQAIGLMEKICEAVEFAHQHGILHRDLKPGNILLRGDGDPLVADFGLAKLSGETAEDGPSLSVSGHVVGTVENMAPEQAESSKNIDARADVYSLGTILYQMCTGRKHFTASGNLIADFQTLQDHEPLRPRAIRPTLDPDLEVIIMKCLRTDPAERYRSVSALLADLQRFRKGEPITARPMSILERSAKVVRRNKLATATTLFLLLATLGAGWQFRKINATRHAAEQNERQARQVQALNLIEKAAIDAADGHTASFPAKLAHAMRIAPDNKPIAQRLVDELLDKNFALPFVDSVNEESDGNQSPPPKFSVERRTDGYLDIAFPEEPGFKTVPVLDITQKLPAPLIPNDSELIYFYEPKNKVLGQYFKRSSRTYIGQNRHSIIFYDLTKGGAIGLPMFLNDAPEKHIKMARFSPDGKKFYLSNARQLASIPVFKHKGKGSFLKLQQVPSRFLSEELSSLERSHGHPVIEAYQISKSGRLAFVNYRSGNVKIVDLKFLRDICETIPAVDGEAFFSRDERSLVLRNPPELKDASSRIHFDITPRFHRRDRIVLENFSGELLSERGFPQGKFFVFHPSRKTLICGGADGKIVIWDLETSQASKVFMSGSPALSLAISPDGKILAVGGLDGRVTLWNADSGDRHSNPLNLGNPVSSLKFCHQGLQLAAGSWADAENNIHLKVWDLESGKELLPPRKFPLKNTEAFAFGSKTAQIGNIDFSQDNRYILAETLSDRPSAVLFDLKDGTPLQVPATFITSAAFTPSGKSIAYSLVSEKGVSHGMIVPIESPLQGINLRADSNSNRWQKIALSPDGRLACLYGENLSMFDAKDGKLLWEKNPSTMKSIHTSLKEIFIHSVSFDSTGEEIVVCCRDQSDGMSFILNSKTGILASRVTSHNRLNGNILFSEFGHDSRWIAAGSRNDLEISRRIRVSEEVLDWLPEFAEAYSGYQINAEGRAVGIPPHERVANLKKILARIEKKNDGLSTIARWLSTPSRERTVAPFSSLPASQEQTNDITYHEFQTSNKKLVVQGVFKSLFDMWSHDYEMDRKDFDGIIETDEGDFLVRTPEYPFSLLFNGRKISLTGNKINNTELPRTRLSSIAALSVENWNDIEDLPLTGVVSRKWSGTGRYKKRFLQCIQSDGTKVDLAFHPIAKVSLSTLDLLEGKEISVFLYTDDPEDSESMIQNPMDISLDGVPLGYLMQAETIPVPQSLPNFLPTNGESQTVRGSATRFFRYIPGLLLLELTLDGGEKVGLVLPNTRFKKDELLANALENLVGKRIVATGRGLKLLGRPQLLLESLQDLRVENAEGQLVNPWHDVVFKNFTHEFAGFEAVTASGKVVHLESNLPDGSKIFEIQNSEGNKIQIILNDSICQNLTDEVLLDFVGKEVEVVGKPPKVNKKNRIEILDIRDLRIVSNPNPISVPSTVLSSQINANPPNTDIKNSEGTEKEITISGRATNFSSKSGGRFKTLDLLTNEGEIIILSFRLKGDNKENPEEMIRSFADKTITAKGNISSYYNKKQLIVTDFGKISISENPTTGD